MSVLSYEVPGDPIPKARPRFSRRTARARTPKRTKSYARSVRLCTLAALGQLKRAGLSWDLDARYEVQLIIHRSTRQSLDVDNVGKAFCDAVQKPKRGGRALLFTDDVQVDHLTIARGSVDAKNPRLVVLVRSLTVAESEAIALAVEQCMGDVA